MESCDDEHDGKTIEELIIDEDVCDRVGQYSSPLEELSILSLAPIDTPLMSGRCVLLLLSFLSLIFLHLLISTVTPLP